MFQNRHHFVLFTLGKRIPAFIRSRAPSACKTSSAQNKAVGGGGAPSRYRRGQRVLVACDSLAGCFAAAAADRRVLRCRGPPEGQRPAPGGCQLPAAVGAAGRRHPDRQRSAALSPIVEEAPPSSMAHRNTVHRCSRLPPAAASLVVEEAPKSPIV